MLVHIPRYVWKVSCLYSFAVWVYGVTFQFVNPDSVYWGLAWLLPIRLDYVTEAAFVLSFVSALLW